jgi:hypothetical protein
VAQAGLFVDAESGPRFGQRLSVTNSGARAFTLNGGVLEFRAESLSTDYTGKNPYVVSWGPAPAPKVA